MVLDVRIVLEGAGSIAVLFIQGDVDLETEGDLAAAIQAALTGPVREVVVDLAAVPFLDSSGVRVLLQGHQTAHLKGATLRVRNPQRLVDDVLQITEVAPLLGLPARKR